MILYHGIVKYIVCIVYYETILHNMIFDLRKFDFLLTLSLTSLGIHLDSCSSGLLVNRHSYYWGFFCSPLVYTCLFFYIFPAIEIFCIWWPDYILAVLRLVVIKYYCLLGCLSNTLLCTCMFFRMSNLSMCLGCHFLLFLEPHFLVELIYTNGNN